MLSSVDFLIFQGWRILHVNESFVFPRLLVQKCIYCNNSLFPILETKTPIVQADHSARVDSFVSGRAEERGGRQPPQRQNSLMYKTLEQKWVRTKVLSQYSEVSSRRSTMGAEALIYSFSYAWQRS